MKRHRVALIVIIIVAAALRLCQLGQVPVSPDWDEAALGYNAYSILKTGRDEYGTFLPLTFRSFDDYKPPLYVYLTVPSVAIFGLNAWSVRLPSAVMGILAVLGTYFLVRELFRKTKNQEPGTRNLPLVSSALLAISPWHVVFSRIAFESNIGLTVAIWAATSFLVGLRKRIFLPISAALFGLGMYTYHSERVFLPLLVVLLVSIYWSKLVRFEMRRSFIWSLAVGLLFVIPLIPILFNKTSMLRLKGTSSFTDQTNMLSRTIPKLEQDQKNGDAFGAFLDNRRFVWVKTVASGYLSHFSINWLFLTGDNPRHHAPDMGLLYLWELPFLLYGIYYLLRTKNYEPGTKLLFGWLLIAPIAAAPTTGLPHAVRTLVFLPTFQIITAVGMLACLSRIKRGMAYIAVPCCLFFVGLNIVYFLNSYFVHTNPEYSEHWQYGYKEAVEFTEKNKNRYEKVIVTTMLDQSYMFFLFYTKYDPVQYLAGGGTKSGSFEESENRFDKYEFRRLDWSKERRDGTVLFVGAPGEIPHGNVLNIQFLNGKPAMELADQPCGAP